MDRYPQLKKLIPGSNHSHFTCEDGVFYEYFEDSDHWERSKVCVSPVGLPDITLNDAHIRYANTAIDKYNLTQRRQHTKDIIMATLYSDVAKVCGVVLVAFLFAWFIRSIGN